jgi:hypothetical protein
MDFGELAAPHQLVHQRLPMSDTAIRRRGRVLTAVNGAVAVAIVALVAAVALVVKAPAPPGIAEFAPQASKPITQAPPGQSSRFGNGSVRCAGGANCAAHGPGRADAGAPTGGRSAGVPSALQCFTWPDGSVTQTFDPQSPPCIATWSGHDNGGATAPGVTATTIRLGFPQVQPASSSSYAKLTPIVNFVNSHFELYGRRIQLVPFPSQQATQDVSTGNATVTGQQADAREAISRHLFAATDFVDYPTGSALSTYIDTLAASKVISLSGGWLPPFVSTVGLARHAPYEWTYEPTTTELSSNFATMACRQLVGRPAEWSPDYHATPRKFAFVLPVTSATGGTIPGIDTIKSMLSGCGQKNLPILYYDPNSADTSNMSETFVQFKAQNVTTMIYFPWQFSANPWAPQQTASKVNYTPEWATLGWSASDVSAYAQTGPAESAETFGIAEWNKGGPLATLPWYQSYLDGGGSASAIGSTYAGEPLYHELLMLASGVQMAGPHLTPASFAEALKSAQFPNPGADTAPTYQARVGFGDGRQTMVDDFGAFWDDPAWSVAEDTSASQSGAGDFYQAFCWVQLGNRWAGGWPSQAGYFGSRCR